MKKKLTLFIALLMCLPLCACGKSQAVKAAEDAIAAIGDVSLESADAIANAEKLYGILTDSEKSNVENRLALVDAREAYNDLQGTVIYENAKLAYEKLNEVAALCENGMDDIYGAWYFGIYKVDDLNSYDNIYTKMAGETPHTSSAELKKASEIFGGESMAEKFMKSDWQYCLYVLEEAIYERGDYEKVQNDMKEAESILQELTKTYDDYTYYPKLKDYYAAVSSYVDFFTSPSGSFKQLSDTVNNYETNIRTYQSDVGFLFSK